jgi:RNA polymerase sigma-70 factor (ECF subfamily)
MSEYPTARPPTDAPADARPATTGPDDVLSLAEARLFARAAEGDREAIAEVWHANRRWIAAVLAAHAPRASDIDDLLQEVAATLVAKCRHVRDAASLRGWLRVVAVNAARMAGRSGAIERRSLRMFAGERGMRSAGIDRAAADEARETLALIERLPPLYAEPLMLQATQGLTQRQIAELLDVPETTVETRLARGRRMLRQLVSEREAAADEPVGRITPGRNAPERTHAP